MLSTNGQLTDGLMDAPDETPGARRSPWSTDRQGPRAAGVVALVRATSREW
ncbi:hypothetical protein ACU686_45390 [Yinghuangia aomiensis]